MDLVYDGGDLDAVQDSLSITRAPWSELSLGEFTKCTVTNPPPRLISTEGHGEDVEKGWAWDDEIWNHVDIQPFIPPPALLASWKDREASRIEGC